MGTYVETHAEMRRCHKRFFTYLGGGHMWLANHIPSNSANRCLPHVNHMLTSLGAVPDEFTVPPNTARRAPSEQLSLLPHILEPIKPTEGGSVLQRALIIRYASTFKAHGTLVAYLQRALSQDTWISGSGVVYNKLQHSFPNRAGSWLIQNRLGHLNCASSVNCCGKGIACAHSIGMRKAT